MPGQTEQDDQLVKPAHTGETRVDMGSEAVEHGAHASPSFLLSCCCYKDHNKITSQDTKKDDGSVKTTEQSSGTKPDSANNHKVEDPETGTTTAHTVLVRRGPVKLPARAIAKVGQSLSSCPLSRSQLFQQRQCLMRDTSECLLQLRHLCCDIDMTLAAELQGVQKPGGPTDRHRAF